MSHIRRDRLVSQSEMETYQHPRILSAWECCKVLACLILTISFLPSCATENTGGTEDSISYGFELTELFRLGDESRGDTILFGSIGELVAVDGSGRIFIGEQQDPIIYVLNTDGNLIKTIGREGSGPGDFQRLSSIRISSADTLYIHDSDLGYSSVYEPERLELAYSIAVPHDDSLGKSYSLVGTLDTGFLFTYGRPIRAGSPSQGHVCMLC
ncbi:MAG: 6-bladed beta-propeller [Rhodothermaceae bacterium]|nr:6-bladed beta-propeller [Rhodothermaceae bacterium]MYI84882.1 6-bladed beta-propeller [Rhodothermaceae bacterium]